MPNAHLSHIVSPTLRALAQYWLAKRGDRDMPSRADIDPIEIPALLSRMALLDVLPGTPRFRFRLVGTQVASFTGRDMTGRTVDEAAYGIHTHDAIKVYSSSIDRRGPTYGFNRAVAVGRETLVVEWLNLPLSSDGKAVDVLIIGLDAVAPTSVHLTEEDRVSMIVASRIFSLDFD